VSTRQQRILPSSTTFASSGTQQHKQQHASTFAHQTQQHRTSAHDYLCNTITGAVAPIQGHDDDDDLQHDGIPPQNAIYQQHRAPVSHPSQQATSFDNTRAQKQSEQYAQHMIAAQRMHYLLLFMYKFLFF
jgi:hypothetical protein